MATIIVLAVEPVKTIINWLNWYKSANLTSKEYIFTDSLFKE